MNYRIQIREDFRNDPIHKRTRVEATRRLVSLLKPLRWAGISRGVIYARIRRSMTDRADGTAAAGSQYDPGPGLIDDFDDDPSQRTIAGILLL